MSDNLSFSLDRAIVFRSEEAGSVDPDFVNLYQINQDQCSLRTDPTRIFCVNYFQV